MPLPLNLAANLALGAALVRVTRRSPALRGGFCSWQLLLLLAFEALVFTPACTAHLRFFPHHALLYAVDPHLDADLEAWAEPLAALAVAGNFAALVGGYAAARHGVRRGRRLWLALPLLVAAAVAGLTLGVAGARLARLGDYDAYWAGAAPWTLAHAAGWAGLACYAAMGGLLAWAAARFRGRDPQIF